MKRVHVYIIGDVTGVGFRSWVTRNAKNLALKGWVRNAANHMVEAVFEGEEEKVDEMIEKSKIGPEVSNVEKIDVKMEDIKGDLEGFCIKY